MSGIPGALWDVVSTTASLLWLAAWVLALGYAFSSAIQVFVKPAGAAWPLGRRRVREIGLAAHFVVPASVKISRTRRAHERGGSSAGCATNCRRATCEAPNTGGGVMTHPATLSVAVSGMHWASCGLLIDDAVEELQGSERCETDSRRGRTVVWADPELATLEDITVAIAAAGYRAEPVGG